MSKILTLGEERLRDRLKSETLMKVKLILMERK
jgi:hypothetical protein